MPDRKYIYFGLPLAGGQVAVELSSGLEFASSQPLRTSDLGSVLQVQKTGARFFCC